MNKNGNMSWDVGVYSIGNETGFNAGIGFNGNSQLTNSN